MSILGLPSLGTVGRAITRRRGTGFRRDEHARAMNYVEIDALGLGVVGLSGTVSVRQFAGEVLDQGPTNSCTANAILDAERTTLHALYGVQAPLGSRLLAYFFGRKSDGFHTVDEGAMPYSVLQAIAEYGICPESVWPFKTANVNRQPPVRAIWDARGRRGIRKSYRVYSRGDDRISAVRAAIASRRAFTLDIPVDDSFAYGREMFYDWDKRGPVRGYHLVEGVSVREDGALEIKNSYGTDWGLGQGYAWLSVEFLLNASSVLVHDPMEPAT